MKYVAYGILVMLLNAAPSSASDNQQLSLPLPAVLSIAESPDQYLRTCRQQRLQDHREKLQAKIAKLLAEELPQDAPEDDQHRVYIVEDGSLDKDGIFVPLCNTVVIIVSALLSPCPCASCSLQGPTQPTPRDPLNLPCPAEHLQDVQKSWERFASNYPPSSQEP